MSQEGEVETQARKPLIMVVINSLESGGAEKVVSTLCNNWHCNPAAAEFADLSLVLLDEAPERYPIHEAVPIVRLGSKGGLIESFRKLRAHVRANTPSLILSFLTRSNVCSVIVANSMGIPVVISERVHTRSHLAQRGPSGIVTAGLVRALYHRSDAIVAVSQGVGKGLIADFKVPKELVHVIPNSYDIASIQQLENRDSEGTPKASKPYIVSVGRLAPAKDHVTLLHAFARLDADLSLEILGEGPELRVLRELSEKLGVSHRVNFRGFLSNPYPIIAGASAYVSTSRAEGFPNAAAEALALGVPVVHTDCPSGPAELLDGKGRWENGVEVCEYGILVRMGDVDSVCSGIQRALDSNVAARLSRSGPVRIMQYSHSWYIDQYLDLLIPLAHR